MTLTYVLAIVAVNWGFHVVPLWHGWPPMSLAVGAVFVFRDFAQREVGHYVLVAMLVGAALSWLMADPFVALASVCAFALSESVEWGIFTVTKKPFYQRVGWSILGCAPLDSALFLWMIGAYSPLAVGLMTVSKLAGALLVYNLLPTRKAVA